MSIPTYNSTLDNTNFMLDNILKLLDISPHYKFLPESSINYEDNIYLKPYMYTVEYSIICSKDFHNEDKNEIYEKSKISLHRLKFYGILGIMSNYQSRLTNYFEISKDENIHSEIKTHIAEEIICKSDKSFKKEDIIIFYDKPFFSIGMQLTTKPK